eukprot:g5240.t1
MRRRTLLLLLCAALHKAQHASLINPPAFGAAPEPYLPLTAGAFSGRPAPESPDPLVRYQWAANTTDTTSLQAFAVRPTNATTLAGTCLGACCSDAAAAPHCFGDSATQPWAATLVVTPAQPVAAVRLDFGAELPAWLELDIDAKAAPPADNTLVLGVSEYALGAYQTSASGHKSGAPRAFTSNATTTLRLETNSELYEGVRYGFIQLDARQHFSAAAAAGGAPPANLTLMIAAARLVAQTKPVNYTGALYTPGDALLEGVWWTAAYTVRANLLKDYIGSVLVDRGDRESWTGDAHPSQQAALVAFHDLDLISQNLASSVHGSGGGFPTYKCYWVLSMLDLFWYAGNSTLLATYEAQVRSILVPLLAEVLGGGQPGLGFVGWDDRTGAGFSNPGCAECQRDFRMILLRAANETAAAYAWAGGGGGGGGPANASFARELHAQSAALATQLRRPVTAGTSTGAAQQPWHSALLLASASDAINAGLATAAEQQAIFDAVMSDSLTLCQLSPFNTYWTLQALGNMGPARAEHALYVLRHCYGGMIQSGATTFWETFAAAPEVISGDAAAWSGSAPGGALPDIVPWTWSGITSLCHPWAAGPAYWMSQHVLGVRPTSPGFQTFVVAPTALCASLPAASGAVPSVHGTFEVSFNLTARQANVTVPGGGDRGPPISGPVGITLLPGQVLASLSVDGRPVPVAAAAAAAAAPRAEAGTTQHWTPPLGPGRHAVSWTLAGGAGGSAPAPAPAARQAPPYPPPRWGAEFLRRDDAAAGDWRRAGYGQQGFKLFGWCAGTPGAGGAAARCARAAELGPARASCGNNTISAIAFADFGDVPGNCINGLGPGQCGSAGNVTEAVQTVCTGRHNCTLECSERDDVPQHGCTVTGDGGAQHNFSLADPCPGQAKAVGLVVNCTGPPPPPPCTDESLPPYVRTVTNAYGRGKLGSFSGLSPGSAANDTRALQAPPGAGGAARSIGRLAEGVIIALDVAVDPAVGGGGGEYTFSAYFVDWERQGRVSSVSLLNATDASFGVLAPMQVLRDYGGGAYLSWRVRGSVRLRVAHVGGDPGGVDAGVSALFWDE